MTYSENPTLQADEIQTPELSMTIARKVFNGDLDIPILRGINMAQVTSDLRLNKIYERGGFPNLAEFLRLGKGRFRYRGYGKASDQKLWEALICFLSEHDVAIIEEERASYENDGYLQRILASPTPEKLIDSLAWKAWRSRFIEKGAGNETICHLSQEIGVPWPLHDSWVEKKIDDFCSKSLKMVSSMEGFGKVKLRSLIKVFAYLLSNKRDENLSKSPEERLVWLRNTIHLERREQDIYNRRSKGETLNAIGVRMGVSRERIRQILKVVIFKYRSPLGLEICANYLNHQRDAIWHKLSKGRQFLSRRHSIDYVDLDENERFALLVYTGDKVKGERFADMIVHFLDTHFEQVAGRWVGLPRSTGSG